MTNDATTGSERDQSSKSGQASDELLPVVYDELRRLARAYMARERAGHSLNATALVHEAYLRLAEGGQWQGRTHFFRASARAMRRLLVEHARHRDRVKRGGDWQRVSFANAEVVASDELGFEELLALDQALEKLEELDPRYARVVELRFFASLTVDDVAEALGVSKRTAEGDWAFARSWLRRELSRAAEV